MALDTAVGSAERLHPLYLVTGLGGSLRRLGGAYAAAGYFAATGSWRTGLLIALAGGAVILVTTFLHWRRFEFRVGASEIRIDSGIFSRTHRSIPFDRVQDVDISQGPLSRLLGLARVRFETGGSAGAKEDDGALEAVALARAEALREQIRARRGPAPAPAEDEVEPAPIFAMDLRRLLTAGLFNFSLALLAALAGVARTLGDVAGIDPFARRFWREALDAGSPIADLLLAHRIAAIIAGTIVLVVIGLATGVVRTVLRDYRFRLDRTETGLRRRRGLVTLTDVTMPLKRVQAAIIGSGPLRDRFGWRDLRLQSLGGDGKRRGDHQVAPLAHDDEVATILAQLDWRPVALDLAWQRVSAAYFAAFALAVSLLLIPAALQFFLIPWLGAAGFAAVAAIVALRWLAWRRYRYALDGDRLLVRSGWWRRRLVMLPLAHIQSIDLTENFISRRFGTASLAIGVASGGGYAGHGIAALPRETARSLRSELLGGAA